MGRTWKQEASLFGGSDPKWTRQEKQRKKKEQKRFEKERKKRSNGYDDFNFQSYRQPN